MSRYENGRQETIPAETTFPQVSPVFFMIVNNHEQLRTHKSPWAAEEYLQHVREMSGLEEDSFRAELAEARRVYYEWQEEQAQGRGGAA